MPTAGQTSGALPDSLRGLLLCLVLCLGGCVTETQGGFNAVRSDSQALRDYIQLALGYLESGDLLNAKRHLESAAALDANNSEVFAIWGLVQAREGEVELADASFRRALRINPRNSQARNNYAAFLFANGRYQDAYTQLEQVVGDTTYSGRAQSFENLGLAALRLGRPEDAEQAFGRALQLNANQLRSNLELSSLSLAKDLETAQNYYRNYLTLLQFNRLGQNARSLWVGLQIESALGNQDSVKVLGGQLEANFSDSLEYQLYQQYLGISSDD